MVSKETIVKLAAAAPALIFMALLRTDADPALWQAGLIAIMLYCLNYAALITAAKDARMARKRKNRELGERDIRRWAEEDFSGRAVS
jgi:hypothetical protein